MPFRHTIDYQLRLPNKLEEIKLTGIDVQNRSMQGIAFERATQMADSVTTQKANFPEFCFSRTESWKLRIAYSTGCMDWTH